MLLYSMNVWGKVCCQLLQTLALFKTKRYLFHSPVTVKETLIQWILIHFLWHTEFQ